MLAVYSAIVLLGSVSASLVFRSGQLYGVPDIGSPFDEERFGTVELADSENAFLEYEFASPTKDPADIENVITGGWSNATPEIVEWLATNRKSLELLRQGSDKFRALQGQPENLSYETMVDVTKNRALSRLARLEAARLIDLGDIEGAWDLHRIALRHSRHVGMYGDAISRLTGIALHLSACEGIVKWAHDTRVDARLLRQSLHDVVEADRLTQPLSVTLRSEYYFTLNTISDSLYARVADESGPLTCFIRNEPTLGIRVLKLVYENWLSQSDLPKYQQSPRCPGNARLFQLPKDQSQSGNLSPNDIRQLCEQSPLAKVLTQHGCPVEFAVRREQSRQSQMEIILAAQLYYRDRQRLPAASVDLVPEYLPFWPLDPFSSKESPMSYFCNEIGDEAIVWSIGPNEIDDSGNVGAQPNAEDYDLGWAIDAPN